MKLTKLFTFAVLSGLISIVCIYLFINYSSAPSISELTQAVKQKESTLFNQLIPDTDLPPEGTRSLFDHLMTQNEGIPFPFSEFATLLTNSSANNELPLSLLIPDGRSLLKGQADNTLPRILLAPDFQTPNTPSSLGINTQGQLFIGFVEAANEIEVISYNEAAGRFEYQLVQNYCEGCVPRVIYARRAICLTCHQGGTPIFSERPWNETNGHLNISTNISKAKGDNSNYHGVSLLQPLATPERFDELTDIGNFMIVSQRVWLVGCGVNGNECRRKLLSLALRYADQPGIFDVKSQEVQALRLSWKDSFPTDGIDVPQSDLKNRDPSGENNNLSDWLYSVFTPDINFGDGAKDNEDLSAFEKLPPLPPAQDPLTLRSPKQTLHKSDIDGVYGIARFFTDDDIASLNKHYHYKLSALLQKIKELPSEVFDPAPFSRVKIMKLLLEGNLQYCCLNTNEMSPPRASGIPELAISKHPDLHLFEQYCFTCHRGNPAKRLDFMSGDNEQQVLEKIQAKTEIREALDWERYQDSDQAAKLMPPKDSVQFKMLSEANKQDRTKMRDTVPSLFSF
jgi:hypothetical protein